MNAVSESPQGNKLFKNSVLAWRAKYLASRAAAQQAPAEERLVWNDEPAQSELSPVAAPGLPGEQPQS